jgi:hypothetical protein
MRSKGGRRLRLRSRSRDSDDGLLEHTESGVVRRMHVRFWQAEQTAVVASPGVS